MTGPDVVEEDFALGTPTEHVAVNEEETREPIEAEEVASGDVVEPVAVNSEEMGDPIDAAEVASGDVAEPVAGCMGRPIDAEEVVPGDFAEVNAVDGAAEWIAEPNAAQQAPDDDDMALEVFPDDVAGEVVPENAADVDADMEANVANNNLTHVVNDDDFDLDDGAQSPPVSAELMYMLDSLYALDGAFADCNRTVMAHETLRFVTAGHPADLVTGLREEYLDTIPHVLLPEPLVNFGLHFRLPPGGVVLVSDLWGALCIAAAAAVISSSSSPVRASRASPS